MHTLSAAAGTGAPLEGLTASELAREGAHYGAREVLSRQGLSREGLGGLATSAIGSASARATMLTTTPCKGAGTAWDCFGKSRGRRLPRGTVGHTR